MKSKLRSKPFKFVFHADHPVPLPIPCPDAYEHARHVADSGSPGADLHNVRLLDHAMREAVRKYNKAKP